MSDKNISVGLIGYRNHAKKLFQLLEENPLVNVEAIFHPTKVLPEYCGTNDLSKLYSLDAIIIASPNHTHYTYLDTLLEQSHCYIFCEKPPVTSFDQLDCLANLPERKKQRIFFNFNYRFNTLNSILSDSQWMNALGKIIHIHIISTHGLAFKQEYSNSWRADSKTNPHAVLETVGIHYLDLLTFHFGNPSEYQYLPSSQSMQGNTLDTACIRLEYSQTFTVNLLFSYAAPFRKLVELTGTEGYLVIDAQEACLFAPRDTFDDDERFTKPPLLFKKEIPNGDYIDSLQKSLFFFIKHVQRQEHLPLSHYNASLESNRLTLQLANSNSAC